MCVEWAVNCVADSFPTHSKDSGDGEKSSCSNRDRLPLRCNETLESSLKIATGHFARNGNKVQELLQKVKETVILFP